MAIAAPVTAGTYLDRNIWVGDVDVYSYYDEIAILGDVSVENSLGFSGGDVSFSRNLIREWYGGGYYILTPGPGIFEVTATFDPPVRAFGLEMMPYDSSHDMTLWLNYDYDSLTQTVGSGGGAKFFGLRSDSGIDSVTISTDSKFWFGRMVVEPFPYEYGLLAYAGLDQTVYEGSTVTLNGYGFDPDGHTLDFLWYQLDGPDVPLPNPSMSNLTFVAPEVGSEGTTLTFGLQVSYTDWEWGLKEVRDFVEVTVLNVNGNHPPTLCELVAKPQILWPPNHKLIPVQILNVTDPNNDQVTITVTGVTQDEPVNGLGDGDTSPDAVIEGNTLFIRAERSGLGNGRVYRINFNVVDSIGGSCAGSAAVCVPHDMGGSTKGSFTCVDDGQDYNSIP